MSAALDLLKSRELSDDTQAQIAGLTRMGQIRVRRHRPVVREILQAKLHLSSTSAANRDGIQAVLVRTRLAELKALSPTAWRLAKSILTGRATYESVFGKSR